uniref:Uncharacterized protein n=1 Tax=Rousettus aegyptiacus TaxID=9407 RepID=A0A7J8JFS9_ROUAE|nr:hypothetical protein HJG63_010106 [Rousettus aegyptiacus]
MWLLRGFIRIPSPLRTALGILQAHSPLLRVAIGSFCIMRMVLLSMGSAPPTPSSKDYGPCPGLRQPWTGRDSQAVLYKGTPHVGRRTCAHPNPTPRAPYSFNSRCKGQPSVCNPRCTDFLHHHYQA